MQLSEIHRYIYITGLVGAMVALPVSPYVVSIGIIVLVANFILEGSFRAKFQNFKSNRPLWVSLAIYIPLLASTLYSDNMGYALSDLRLWLPFLLIPIVVALSNPLNKCEFFVVMFSFVTSVLVATIIATFRLHQYVQGELDDIRQISGSISHIRFSLMINLALALLIYFLAVQRKSQVWVKLTIIACALWFVVFLLMMQTLTGLEMLVILTLITLFFIVRKSKSVRLRWSFFVMTLLCFVGTGYYLFAMVDRLSIHHQVDFESLPKFTANGNKYVHRINCEEYENGYLVNINLCEPELRRAWNARSIFNYDGRDKRGQPINKTLCRYLTSKNLTKDSVGVFSLDSIDVSLIEQGNASVIYRNKGMGIQTKVYEVLWELEAYFSKGQVSGGSIVQRVIYAKSAIAVIAQNPCFGVGWGDVQAKLNDQFKGTRLSSDYWYMPHNQFLTVFAASGIFGLLIFIVALLYPFFKLKKIDYYIPTFFQTMIIVSMLFEDTFETHIGISFAAFLGAIFIYGYAFGATKELNK